HACVVDQQVDGFVIGAQLVGGRADGLQRRQVELLDGDTGAGGGPGDEVGGSLALFDIAHGEHDVCALGGERGGGLVAEPGVGAGDDCRATGLVGNVGGRPLGHGNLLQSVKRGGRSVWLRPYGTHAPLIYSRRHRGGVRWLNRPGRCAPTRRAIVPGCWTLPWKPSPPKGCRYPSTRSPGVLASAPERCIGISPPRKTWLGR